ncbi:nuclear transport factor 2 family protein [Bordetella sp. BOR01]|uniref:nuclear transport factor 2 family protein n=1 Tax=Bordetella sp. BOR01 TaxID=2854779 RepID=UPI001C457E48|nr:nuclear transport factor 2 family protein [Bordetella sp. BOR01]MBV7482976.1 nuclear transport factor 2 family protein [Bordetella sp. BOR01]
MTRPDLAHIEEWGKGMWNVFDRLAMRSRTAGLSKSDVSILDHEEAEVLDVFRRYHYLYDAGNLDGVVSIFSDDCVLLNPRGTYIGSEAIRENYAYLMDRTRFVLHYGTNTLVRFDRGMTQAWLGAFYSAAIVMPDKSSYSGGGTYMKRLRKQDGEWKVFEARITGNMKFDNQVGPPGKSSPPKGTHPRKSGELIEETARL